MLLAANICGAIKSKPFIKITIGQTNIDIFFISDTCLLYESILCIQLYYLYLNQYIKLYDNLITRLTEFVCVSSHCYFLCAYYVLMSTPCSFKYIRRGFRTTVCMFLVCVMSGVQVLHRRRRNSCLHRSSSRY